jgi:thiol-disulfide isomerase/thioredoxin
VPERTLAAALPSFALGPGRPPLSRRTRRRAAALLALLLLATLVAGERLATSPARAPLRVVTIPLADRDASPALLAAAEAVGFEPASTSAGGQVEDAPLVTPAPPSASGLLAPGSAAPPFALRTPTGQRVSLARLRGRTVLLEFFATWCPHCEAEAPHLLGLSRSLAGARYAFVAVDADGETAPSVLAYHIYFELDFPALLDPSADPGSFHSPGSPGRVSDAYRIQTYPTFYVIDARGRVHWAAAGEQPDRLLRAELQAAAGGAAATR